MNGETIKHILKIEKEIVKRIKYELKGKYKPEIYDRVVQLCFKQILEPIVEKRFYHYSFGFRPGRSAEHAIAGYYRLVNISKLHFVVDTDIKGFFNNINHNKLIKQLQRFKSIDKKTFSIIKCMLKIETAISNKEIIFSEKANKSIKQLIKNRDKRFTKEANCPASLKI